MSDQKQILSPFPMNDARIREAIDGFHASDENTRIVTIEGFDISLIRVKVDLNPGIKTELSVTHGNSFVSGFGVRCYNDPNQVMVTSIVSGFGGNRTGKFSLEPHDALCPEGEIDVAYFNVDDDDFFFAPFDLGCFSNLCPLVMNFVSRDGATLDMVLVGMAMTFEGLLDESKFQQFMASMPVAPEPEPPKPLGDPGWSPVGTPAAEDKAVRAWAHVEIFEDVPPRSSHSPDLGITRLHGLMGTVARRGPFALQVWFGDGSPRHVVGLRSFSARGRFKVRSIYSSHERRTILGGSLDLDLADFNGDDCYADLDMGIVSRERPLLLELDNITSDDVVAMLDMVLVSVER